MDESWLIDYITLKGEEVQIKIGYLPQMDLNFFAENPRIYSLIYSDNQVPEQNEIEELLIKRDHVKHLIQAIKANGGLTDPIFVREDNYVVIEGNSRLAAYRALASQDPIKWGKIKCKLLPKNIDEDKIFSLLGEYHIIGKQDWAPYEQAGYLYRRFNNHGTDPHKMAESLGLSTQKVNNLIEVYDFMVTNNDNNPNKWSYYEEYLKKNIVKKARKTYSSLDTLIVKKIKSGEIERAVDLRDNLPKILRAGKKVVQSFLNESKDFTECYEKALDSGVDEDCYQKMKNFRNWVVEDEVLEKISDMSNEIKKKSIFEMNKIKQRIDYILNKIDKVN
jgi:hypothetical protein